LPHPTLSNGEGKKGRNIKKSSPLDEARPAEVISLTSLTSALNIPTSAFILFLSLPYPG
jgi:hypothetical protein